MRELSAILSLVLLLAFSGCASMDKRMKCIVNGAVAGAAIGAGGGAVIGHQGDTDNATEGSLIGAAVGGIVGGTIGCFICKAEPIVGDADGDGVLDDADRCPGTPTGVKVDSKGCPLDSDGDGVLDYKDDCPGTPTGVKVDSKGCPLDSDGDGVPDHRDKCPNTPQGTKVDTDGCPQDIDGDGDGVTDNIDRCPATPKGATVDEFGCCVFENVTFDFNQWSIRPQYHSILDRASECLKQQTNTTLELQGHTDSLGSQEYNQRLSEKRAGAVMNYLLNKGIAGERLTVKGYGFSKPVATNKTDEGRAKNRRVELKPANE